MNAFTADFLAWALTKCPSATYDYSNEFNCALCQFLRETGRAVTPEVGMCFWRELDGPRVPFDPALNTIVAAEPTTFGALATRLERVADEVMA